MKNIKKKFVSTYVFNSSVVASHTCTEGNFIQQQESDASFFGMTSLGSLMMLKFYYSA